MSLDFTLLPLDKGKALRYLGYDGAPDVVTAGLLARAEEMVLQIAEPRATWRQCGLERPGNALRLAGSSVLLTGADIRRHLNGCISCIVLAVTLGFEVEQALRRAMAQDMAFATMLDAACDVAVEQIAKRVQDAAAVPNSCMTTRFSPGYGDLPLAAQHDICCFLDTARQIGLSVTPAHILTPRKSITALIGLSGKPTTKTIHPCKLCRHDRR